MFRCSSFILVTTKKASYKNSTIQRRIFIDCRKLIHKMPDIENHKYLWRIELKTDELCAGHIFTSYIQSQFYPLYSISKTDHIFTGDSLFQQCSKFKEFSTLKLDAMYEIIRSMPISGDLFKC